MFNTFFGGGGMGGMGGGGGGQQKFKMNMGGGGMGGGGGGGGGIEELLMGGMCNCHATRMTVLSMPRELWQHDVLLYHSTNSSHGACVYLALTQHMQIMQVCTHVQALPCI